MFFREISSVKIGGTENFRGEIPLQEMPILNMKSPKQFLKLNIGFAYHSIIS